ncbi:MAG: OsmC family protein [Desulfovibrionaceae bacterium]|nr:OsmC family protein [Desulfovibrionaceae bacterium]
METCLGVYDGGWGIECCHIPSGSKLHVNPYVGYSPTELCVTALATCTLLKLGYYAKKHGLNIKGTKFIATEGYDDCLKRITTITVVYIMAGGPFTDQDKQGFEAAAASCPVHNSLLTEIDIKISFNWYGEQN